MFVSVFFFVKMAEKDWFTYLSEYIQKLDIHSTSESFCELGKLLFSKKGRDEDENGTTF